MNKLKLFWFGFYIVAMVLAFFGPGWTVISGFMIGMLLVTDSISYFHVRGLREWKTSSVVVQTMAGKVISSANSTPIIVYILTFIRSIWGIGIIVSAFIMYAKTPRLDIFPLASFLEYESDMVFVLYVSIFALVVAIGVLLSNINYLDCWKEANCSRYTANYLIFSNVAKN